jgi:hypothetical protein
MASPTASRVGKMLGLNGVTNLKRLTHPQLSQEVRSQRLSNAISLLD